MFATKFYLDICFTNYTISLFEVEQQRRIYVLVFTVHCQIVSNMSGACAFILNVTINHHNNYQD